ncbi:MAG TPA: helix-turn-helix transcriptional regulator [Acidimicrobiales bacterium]|nr:helix-turn-helix transcriptional regulator [Acidimicrobiales bacterium]
MATTAPSLLLRARRAGGLSQRELAGRAGVTQPVIAAYERGRRQPSLPTLRRLVRAAGYDLDIGLRPLPPRPDPERAGRHLVMALELAEHLPRRRRTKEVAFPRFPGPAR